MSFRSLFLPIALVLVLFSCRKTESPSALILAEQLIEERPDSALILLRGMAEPEEARFAARHKLLTAIALDKSYVDDGSYLEEIIAAESWYNEHGNKRDKMLAAYYLADQQHDSGLLPDAAFSFAKALHLAEQLKDWYYCGLSSRELSYIFTATYQPYEARDKMEDARVFFVKAGKKQHSEHAALMLSHTNYNCQNYSKALAMADSLYRHSESRALKADAQSIAALSMLEIKDYPPDSVLGRFKLYHALGGIPVPHLLASEALAHARNNEAAIADSLLSEAYLLASGPADSMRVSGIELSIRAIPGQKEAGDELLAEHYTNISKEATKALSQSAIKSVSRYQDTVNSDLSERLKERLAAVAVLSALLLLSAAAMIWTRKRSKQREKELSSRLAFALQQIEPLNFDPLEQLAAFYCENNYNKDVYYSPEFSLFLKQFEPGNELCLKLESMADSKYDNIVSRLRTSFSDISEEDIRLLTYLICGLSYEAICMLFHGRSKQKYYSTANRLRSKISNSDNPDKVFFLSHIEKRTTSGKKIPHKPQ